MFDPNKICIPFGNTDHSRSTPCNHIRVFISQKPESNGTRIKNLCLSHPTLYTQVTRDLDTSFERIFTHLGFKEEKKEKAMKIATQHHLNRKTDKQIVNKMSHVSSRKTSNWRKYFLVLPDFVVVAQNRIFRRNLIDFQAFCHKI